MLAGTFATVRRRLEVLVVSVSENEDLLLRGDGCLGRSVAVSISAVLSASSSVAISVAFWLVSNDRKELLMRNSINFASVLTVALRLRGPQCGSYGELSGITHMLSSPGTTHHQQPALCRRRKLSCGHSDEIESPLPNSKLSPL